jgi:hypothetical protein
LADASQVASQPLGGFLKCLGPDFDLADVLRFVGAAAMVADAVDLLDEVLGALPPPKWNWHKTGGLKWDLLPLDFLPKIR